jgi:cytochrome P450
LVRRCVCPDEIHTYTILRNISQNPKEYPDPTAFNPDRFVPKEGVRMPLDPRKYAFGYGRRLCPGQHLGEGNAWITLATIIATFDLKRKKDANGVEIKPKVAFDDALVRQVAVVCINRNTRSHDMTLQRRREVRMRLYSSF